MKDLSQLADAVMKEVDQAQLVKQADVAYTLKTETGNMLLKVAALLRTEGSAKITYADLAQFRKDYDV